MIKEENIFFILVGAPPFRCSYNYSILFLLLTSLPRKFLFCLASLFIWVDYHRFINAPISGSWELMILTVANKSYPSFPFQVNLFVNNISKIMETLTLLITICLKLQSIRSVNLCQIIDKILNDKVLSDFLKRFFSKLCGWWCPEIDQKSRLVYKVIQCTTW